MQEISLTLQTWEPESENTMSEELILKIKELNPFKNLFIFNNLKTKQQLIYFKKDDGDTELFGPLNQFNAKTIKDFLLLHNKDKFSDICKQLQPLINPKKPELVSILDIIQNILNVVQPEFDIPSTNITKDPHPAVLSTYSHVPALKYIPFTVQDVTIDDLNPYLKDILFRIEDHEYFCAHLYTNWIGIKTPCVLYLYGEGETGKTSLLNMLISITCNSGTYDASDRFNYYNMYSKSLIIQSENDSGYFFQQRVLKAVTGGDPVQLEQKGQTAFTGYIRGQLIVTSNNTPTLLGTKDEARRLRFFTMVSHGLTKDQLLGQDNYEQELGSTQNEFLNYCRICYEKLKTDGDLVKDPPHHLELIRSLRDGTAQNIFQKIMKEILEIKKSHELVEEGTCEISDFIDAIKKHDKGAFAFTNFEKMLTTDYRVRRKFNQYIGIQKRQRKE